LQLVTAIVYFVVALAAANVLTKPLNSLTNLSLAYHIGDIIAVSWSTTLSHITLTVSVWRGKVVGVLFGKLELLEGSKINL
jgi:hypothetical protein